MAKFENKQKWGRDDHDILQGPVRGMRACTLLHILAIYDLRLNRERKKRVWSPGLEKRRLVGWKVKKEISGEEKVGEIEGLKTIHTDDVTHSR